MINLVVSEIADGDNISSKPMQRCTSASTNTFFQRNANLKLLEKKHARFVVANEHRREINEYHKSSLTKRKEDKRAK